MYNQIEHNDNYSDTSGSLWQNMNKNMNNRNGANDTINDSLSFKNKSNILEN